MFFYFLRTLKNLLNWVGQEMIPTNCERLFITSYLSIAYNTTVANLRPLKQWTPNIHTTVHNYKLNKLKYYNCIISPGFITSRVTVGTLYKDSTCKADQCDTFDVNVILNLSIITWLYHGKSLLKNYVKIVLVKRISAIRLT